MGCAEGWPVRPCKQSSNPNKTSFSNPCLVVLGLLAITSLNMSESHDSFSVEMRPGEDMMCEEAEAEELPHDVHEVLLEGNEEEQVETATVRTPSEQSGHLSREDSSADNSKSVL